jgi:hypothetical protein
LGSKMMYTSEQDGIEPDSPNPHRDFSPAHSESPTGSLPQIRPLNSSELIELIESLNERSARDLLARARIEAEQFLIRYETLNGAALESAHEQISHWFATPEAQVSLAFLTDEVLELLVHTADPGYPGHDFRHMFLKDPLSALRYCIEENIEDYRTTFLLSSLAHDLGRLVEHHLVETRLTEVPGRWHGELSFYLFSRLLDGEEGMPEPLKNELRYAVLAHSSVVPSESFFLSAVQRADREQILGSEGIFRLIAFDAGYGSLSLESISRKSRKHTLTLPGELPHEHLSETLEFFLRNLADPPGELGITHHREAQIVAGVFLKLMSSENEFYQTFHPEITDLDEERAGRRFKTRLPDVVWQGIEAGPSAEEWRIIRALCSQYSTQDLLDAAMSGVGMADVNEARVPLRGDRYSHETVGSVLKSKLEELSEEAARRFSRALAYALVQRSKFDNEDQRILDAVGEAYPQMLSIPRRVAVAIARYLNS